MADGSDGGDMIVKAPSPLSRNGPCVLMLYSTFDLRVHDNYALALAVRCAKQRRWPLVCAYCFDIRTLAQPSLVGGFFRTGPLRARFLIQCVEELRKNLGKCSNNLIIRVGFPETEIPLLCQQLNAKEVFAHTMYVPHEHAVQSAIRRKLEEEHNAKFSTIWGTTLIHIDDLSPSVGEMRESMREYFDMVMRTRIRPTAPYNCQDGRMKSVACVDVEADGVDAGSVPTLDELGYGLVEILSEAPLMQHFGGEKSAFSRIDEWLLTPGVMNELKPLHLFKMREQRVDQSGRFASRLGPWIAHGCLSPRALWEILREYSYERMTRRATEGQVNEMLLRLSRRDFWHFVSLRYGPALFFPYGPRPGGTDSTPELRSDEKVIRRWCDALTGFPFADAAMKELRFTGCASFQGRQALAWLLTRGLGQDWRMGAEWFERCLLDYDPCVNWGSFAYFAGLLSDPFGDPVHTVHYLAHKHDQSGITVRTWLPQLTRVPDTFIHRPHVITEKMQRMHGVHLGKNYPFPVKLWHGAHLQNNLRLPAYYADKAKVQQMAGLGEAMKFGTKLLDPALLPFSRESRQSHLVAAAVRRGSGRLPLLRL